MKKKVWQWLLSITPFFLFLIFLPFSSSCDLSIAQLFYTPETKGQFVENGFTYFFYHYGEWPAFILGSLSLCILGLSFLVPSMKQWRKAALFSILTFFLGLGLIVNGLLKEYIERPRPKQTKEFGGPHSFRPVFKPQFILKQKPDAQKSFPSGHVTTGAYFFVCIFLAKRARKKLAYHLAISFSLIWTLSLMACRILQGGHYFSDTLFSVLLIWYMALFFDWLLWKSPFATKNSQTLA